MARKLFDLIEIILIKVQDVIEVVSFRIHLKDMVIWIIEFSSRGYKIRKIFAKESTYSKEIIEF